MVLGIVATGAGLLCGVTPPAATPVGALASPPPVVDEPTNITGTLVVLGALGTFFESGTGALELEDVAIDGGKIEREPTPEPRA